eukprot:Skav212476  [mRNA]  locus=scaffold385:380188:380439:+ [translate_table: standard]
MLVLVQPPWKFTLRVLCLCDDSIKAHNQILSPKDRCKSLPDARMCPNHPSKICMWQAIAGNNPTETLWKIPGVLFCDVKARHH